MGPHRALENQNNIYLILEWCGRRRSWHRNNYRHDRDESDDFSGAVDVAFAERKSCWRPLALCSRVSRAFSEPALRLLWRELPSLYPLIFVCQPTARVDMEGIDNLSIRVRTPSALQSAYGCRINAIPRPDFLRKSDKRRTSAIQDICGSSQSFLTTTTIHTLAKILITHSSSTSSERPVADCSSQMSGRFGVSHLLSTCPSYA